MNSPLTTDTTKHGPEINPTTPVSKNNRNPSTYIDILESYTDVVQSPETYPVKYPRSKTNLIDEVPVRPPRSIDSNNDVPPIPAKRSNKTAAIEE